MDFFHVGQPNIQFTQVNLLDYYSVLSVLLLLILLMYVLAVLSKACIISAGVHVSVHSFIHSFAILLCSRFMAFHSICSSPSFSIANSVNYSTHGTLKYSAYLFCLLLLLFSLPDTLLRMQGHSHGCLQA